jgi:hypothetical protein
MNTHSELITTNTVNNLTATEIAIVQDTVTYEQDISFTKPINDEFQLSVKVVIAVLTPSMDVDKKIVNTEKLSTIKIQNRGTVGADLRTTKTTAKNYLTLKVPFHIALNFITGFSFNNANDIPIYEYLRGGISHNHNAKLIKNNTFKYNTMKIKVTIPQYTEFLVSFIGNNPNKAVITGINLR